MTVNELYRQGLEMLDYAFIENASFDARWLIEKAVGIDSKQFALTQDCRRAAPVYTRRMGVYGLSV